MKKYLKIFVILFLGVFLMAGTSFSTPYVETEYAAYEYYQAVQGQDGIFYNDVYDVAYDYWESGTLIAPTGLAEFSFDFKNLSNEYTNTALDMIDDVEGWGPAGTPISDAFISFTLFSFDTEFEGFEVDLDIFLDSDPAYNITLTFTDINVPCPLVTLTIPMMEDLLAAWQNNPDGLLTINAFINPFGEALGGYNDFGIVEAGIGVNSNPVPEPSTILLLGAGLLGLVAYNRKRFSKKS